MKKGIDTVPSSVPQQRSTEPSQQSEKRINIQQPNQHFSTRSLKPENLPAASFQVEGGNRTMSYLTEGIAQVTEATSHFKRAIIYPDGPTVDDPAGNIMNLTNKAFTKHEFRFLNKNLNFCPRPNQYNKNK